MQYYSSARLPIFRYRFFMVAMSRKKNDMFWKVLSNALRMSLGMLSMPRVFPFEIFFRHVSYTTIVNIDIIGIWGDLFEG